MVFVHESGSRHFNHVPWSNGQAAAAIWWRSLELREPVAPFFHAGPWTPTKISFPRLRGRCRRSGRTAFPPAPGTWDVPERHHRSTFFVWFTLSCRMSMLKWVRSKIVGNFKCYLRKFDRSLELDKSFSSRATAVGRLRRHGSNFENDDVVT